MREELALIEPAWHSASELTLSEVGRALAGSGALMAHRVLASFLESYLVVAECLPARPVRTGVDEGAFLRECLEVGQQLRLQRRITSGESLSTELFRSALKLAENRGLLDVRDPELIAARQAFVDELRELVRRIRVVATIDRGQRETDALAPTAAGGV
jgi:glycerol-3-phosphate O-acyltransferase